MRCRGRGKSVCIGFERWMKHIPAEAQVLVFFTGSSVGFLAHRGVAFGTFLGHLLGLNPGGVSLFRMHRPLHVLGALKFKPTEAEAAIHAVHCTVNFFFIWVPFRMRCRGSGASVSQRFEGRMRHTVVFRRFGRAAEGAVRVSVL